MKKLTARKLDATPSVTRKPKHQAKPKPSMKADVCFDHSNYLLEEHPELEG